MWREGLNNVGEQRDEVTLIFTMNVTISSVINGEMCI